MYLIMSGIKPCPLTSQPTNENTAQDHRDGYCYRT